VTVQRTIAREGRVAGIGLHSGESCHVVFKPAPPDTGMMFVRTDLPGPPHLAAHPDYLCKRQRRTALADGDMEIHTPEHLLAAAVGLGIHNLIIEMDSQEMPGLDGSALEFVRCLQEAGIVAQDAVCRDFTVTDPVSVDTNEASIVALPYQNGLRITYTLDDHHGVFPGPMMVDLELTEERFVTEIAPARTFVTRGEVAMLQAAGLGKGANTQNTLIFDGAQPIDNTLRFADEAARHKVLDLIGDLAMSTRRLNAHIIAVRSGHGTNMALVQELNRRIVQVEKPAMVLDIAAILACLPHRYPFLLVDRVTDLRPGRAITCLKNVSINEGFFQGHFPGSPVMPGVLLVEAMAQAGAILLLTDPCYRGKIPYFMSMDRVKFRRAVYPGDQMRIEIEALRMRSRMSACRGRVYVGNDLACEGEIRSVLMDPM
jgi:UDP-3-O-[3-hydroxymyristoyl] N-acetylglucosamine deacetylase/3-hydroxyacyl-[acyl-carrier-protein] dehydratase